MNLYFAGIYTGIEFLLKHNCNLLSSFVECKNKDLSIIDKNIFFLDSGAFSVFTGTVGGIDIDQYIDFIKKNKIITYAGLDVIGDFKKTYENCKYMERHGLQPIPTFHYGSDFNELKKLCVEYDYIAIGGMAGNLKRKRNTLYKFVNDVFKTTKKKKLHGFGVTSDKILKNFPFYSVDSTGWISAVRHRTVSYFNGDGLLRAESLNKKNIPKGVKDGSRILMNMGVTNKSDKYLYQTCVLEYLKFEKYITELWTKRGVTWDD